jgi:GntR family transcriptional regulator/MocR family aminotransferase
MSRRGSADIALPISLRRQAGAPAISDQMAEQLRAATLDGTLRPGDRLPSIRELATRLKVARATVDTAYAQLVAEGYLETRIGSGTRIAAQLPQETLSVASRTANPRIAAVSSARPLPAQALRLAGATQMQSPQRQQALAVGVPTEELSPGKAWTRIATRLARTPWKEAGYAAPHGHAPLREQVAEYVRRMRGIRCEPDQVLITAGTQQGLYLCARVLFSAGDAVWMENPCYQPLMAVAHDAGLKPVPVPVDAKGLDVEAGIALAPKAAGAFVTPSHQFPLGMVMSMERRLALLNWARASGGWIVEDDYDSELRYAGRPFPALQGLDGADEAVVYLGTFSKMLFPGLRLGYMIAPKPLVPAFAGARLLIDRQSASAEQQLLAEFMAGGHYEAHIRRIKFIFAERRRVLLESCRDQLSAYGEMVEGDQGMHAVFQLHDGRDDVALGTTLRSGGIEARPLSPYYNGGDIRHGLILGFGSFQPEAIRNAVRGIGAALEESLA